MGKKLLCVLLAVVILVGLLAVPAFSTHSEKASGNTGKFTTSYRIINGTPDNDSELDFEKMTNEVIAAYQDILAVSGNAAADLSGSDPDEAQNNEPNNDIDAIVAAYNAVKDKQ